MLIYNSLKEQNDLFVCCVHMVDAFKFSNNTATLNAALVGGKVVG